MADPHRLHVAAEPEKPTTAEPLVISFARWLTTPRGLVIAGVTVGGIVIVLRSWTAARERERERSLWLDLLRKHGAE